MINIYNTLTNKKEEFVPLNDGQVSMYTCGVTVYDVCHIGHARSMYEFEVMRRYFEYCGFKVNFVRNITDIDDKILNKAVALAEELKISLDEAWHKVLEKNIAGYNADVQALGLRTPDCEPKASEYVEKIIAYVQTLIDKDYAYESEGSVYFRTRKYHDSNFSYGELSGKKIDDLLSGVRKGEDTAKDEALDFVLWKAKKEGEVGWDSPWGEGRPGWHIECSVMSTDILGNTFDIHGGGLDLIFPHHENEIAQSKAHSGEDYARYWVHHGLLSINKQKMAKSLGNFVTIADAVDKYPADVLKVFYLQASYSSTVDFSWDRMQEADKAFAKIQSVKEILDSCTAKDLSDAPEQILKLKNSFEEAMNDDFNTPKALAVFFELCHLVNKAQADSQDELSPYAKTLLEQWSLVMAFDFKKKEQVLQISETEILALITKRSEAKKNRDFATADAVRDELLAKGIVLKDKRGGETVWEVQS